MTDQSAGFPLDAGRHYETREGGKVLIRLAGAEAGTSGFVFAGDNGMLYLPTGRIARDGESPKDCVALASVAETEDGQAMHNYYPTPNASANQQDRIQANLDMEERLKQPIAKTPADEAVIAQGGEKVIRHDAEADVEKIVTVDTTFNTDREEAPLQGVKNPDVKADEEALQAQHKSELIHPEDGEQSFESPSTFGGDPSSDTSSDDGAAHQTASGETDDSHFESVLTPTPDGGGVSTTPPPVGSPGHNSVDPVATESVESADEMSADDIIEARNRRILEQGGTNTATSTDDKE